MDNSKQEELRNELKAVCEKYGVKNVVFGGEVPGDKFIGFYGLENIEDFREFCSMITNSARLYQSGREKLFRHLDHIASIT